MSSNVFYICETGLLSPRLVASARQLGKALEVPLVNDLGYAKRYVRCLQVMSSYSLKPNESLKFNFNPNLLESSKIFFFLIASPTLLILLFDEKHIYFLLLKWSCFLISKSEKESVSTSQLWYLKAWSCVLKMSDLRHYIGFTRANLWFGNDNVSFLLYSPKHMMS